MRMFVSNSGVAPAPEVAVVRASKVALRELGRGSWCGCVAPLALSASHMPACANGGAELVYRPPPVSAAEAVQNGQDWHIAGPCGSSPRHRRWWVASGDADELSMPLRSVISEQATATRSPSDRGACYWRLRRTLAAMCGRKDAEDGAPRSTCAQRSCRSGRWH
jgi:hypothetical protein